MSDRDATNKVARMEAEKAFDAALSRATTPGFTGSITLELHAADGILKQAVETQKTHRPLAKKL